MSSLHLAFSSDGISTLSSLAVGAAAVIVDVLRAPGADDARVDRLLALGVTPGAAVTMLQRCPGIVFLCDQTELAVERCVADAVIVRRPEMSR